MTAKKKSAGSSATKKASKKASSKAAPKRKKADAKKTAEKGEAYSKKESPPKRSAPAKKTSKAESVTSSDINLGHVFALRPRANTSFRPNDFMAAKRSLRDEKYESIEEAARAVADEAISLTRGSGSKIETGPGR